MHFLSEDLHFKLDICTQKAQSPQNHLELHAPPKPIIMKFPKSSITTATHQKIIFIIANPIKIYRPETQQIPEVTLTNNLPIELRAKLHHNKTQIAKEEGKGYENTPSDDRRDKKAMKRDLGNPNWHRKLIRRKKSQHSRNCLLHGVFGRVGNSLGDIGSIKRLDALQHGGDYGEFSREFRFSGVGESSAADAGHEAADDTAVRG